MADITSPDSPSRHNTAWNAVLPRRNADALERSQRRTLSGPNIEPERLGYELVGRPEPPPVPNGWFVLEASDALANGEIRSVIAAQRELVLFRDEHGDAHVLDAHCPHMGAHLGGGEVQGITVACPYHGWRFAGTGECVEIPYSDSRIPSRACVRSYPSCEVSGMIMFWFHAGGAVPSYEIPELHGVDDDNWIGPVEYRTEFVASLQDMAENNVDYTHFFFVHGREALTESSSQVTTDGPFSTVVEHFGETNLVFTRHTYGPGVALLEVDDLMTVLTTTTPIDRRHVRLLWHFYIPRPLEAASEEIIEGVTGAFGLGADLPIWRDKIFVNRPLLVKGDGPIAEFRRWYSQFYEGNPETA